MLIYDIKPQPKIDTDWYNYDEVCNVEKANFEKDRIIDLRPNTKDTEFNINDEDLKNGYIGYASWDSKISIPLRS